MITQVKIQGEKISLFEDESINVIASVLDILDISKNTNEFTRNFTIPADSINNKILKFWFDADIDNQFDARVKQPATITLGGIPFKGGFVQLIKVNVKEGKASSYSINYSGKLSDISKKAGDKKLKDLDLITYNHTYNSATVRTGLTSSLFSGDIIYNALVKKQYFYQDGNNTSTSTLQNVAFTGGADSGIIWNDLKPSIKLIRLIEAIEILLGVTFSRHFFGTSEFEGLFMWLNAEKSKDIIGNSQIIDWTSQDVASIWIDLATNIGTFPCNANVGIEFQMNMEITPKAGFVTIPYVIKMYQDNELYYEESVSEGSWSLQPNSPAWTIFSDSGEQTKLIYWEVTAESQFEFDARLYQRDTTIGIVSSTYAADNLIEGDFKIKDNIPDIKVIDFLKGLFSRCKLIVIPEDDGTFYVNTLNAYRAEGGSFDVTKHIDKKEYPIERGTIFNEISFKFEDPTTIVAAKYKEDNDRGFGDEELIVREDMNDPTSEQLQGDSFTLKLPFEQVIFERIPDVVGIIKTHLVYGAIIDENLNPVNPKPVIFYNKNTNQTLAKTIGFQNDSGTKDATYLATINNPLHTSNFTNSLYSTTFSKETNIWSGLEMSKTLYTNHYASFISDTFNIKKREYKFTAKDMPIGIITSLKLNDLLIIKNRYYVINKYSYDIVTGSAEFQLVNYFGNVGVGQVRSSTKSISVSSAAQSELIYVYNLLGSTFNKVDISGDGVAWLSSIEDAATQQGILSLDFTENVRTARSMFLDITNKGITSRILVRQDTGGLTVDNTITVDTNLTTVDNG